VKGRDGREGKREREREWGKREKMKSDNSEKRDRSEREREGREGKRKREYEAVKRDGREREER